MLKAKSADFYAFRSGVDREIAERDIVLTYALRLLQDSNRAEPFAFKGGTCLRKVYLASTGRFSMDLDFTARSAAQPDDAIIELMEVFNSEFHGIRFHLDRDWRITKEGTSFTDMLRDEGSRSVAPSYAHDWNEAGRFDLQVSLREKPTLAIEVLALEPQPYFHELEFAPPAIPCLAFEEVLSEKIRAAYQRTKARDLYDLILAGSRPFDRSLVRRLAVIKLWQARDPFDPVRLTEVVRHGSFDWSDLRRLVRRSTPLKESEIIARWFETYSFLDDLTEEEKALAGDARVHRREDLHEALIAACREGGAGAVP